MIFEMKLPDVGEGVAEAELVEWMVDVGDHVTPATVIAEVLTDKATVEVSSPVTGEVAVLHGEPGDVLAVGGALISIETERDAERVERARGEASDDTPGAPGDGEAAPGDGDSAPGDDGEAGPGDDGEADRLDTTTTDVDGPTPDRSAPATTTARPLAAPAVRRRADDLGVDLAAIRATGPDGRVVHADLDRELVAGRGSPSQPGPRRASAEPRTERVRGVRRRIAERLLTAWQMIPHITYVDDVDVSELERLRAVLNDRAASGDERLTILPFLARAVVLALADQPGLNAHYDHETEMLTTFDAVHIGIATQTDDGLRVPVIEHAEARDVRDLAAEIARLSAAARDGSATREQLTGSTITITSLGALGGVATTPIINPPELAIIGVNKIETRPVWRDGSFQPRQVMNLSSSFDHRMVDGWDAATFVQRIEQLLETPSLLFGA